MGYLRPVDAPISCSWHCHRDRTPPSAEPGTDYAAAYGTSVLAAEAGVVVDRKTSNSGATGRYVTVDLDDGRRVRYLHLSSVSRAVGDRVARGTRLGASGASGNGSDWGYGAHVHTTLFPRHTYDFDSTIDFEDYVGPPAGGPQPRETDMMLYCITDNDKRPDAGGTRTRWALAGSGDGKAAWLETGNENRANDWRDTGQFGNSTWLSHAEWDNLRVAYRPGLADTLRSTSGLPLILLGLIVLAVVGLGVVLAVT